MKEILGKEKRFSPAISIPKRGFRVRSKKENDTKHTFYPLRLLIFYTIFSFSSLLQQPEEN